jgi:hypothetical protein
MGHDARMHAAAARVWYRPAPPAPPSLSSWPTTIIQLAHHHAGRFPQAPSRPDPGTLTASVPCPSILYIMMMPCVRERMPAVQCPGGPGAAFRGTSPPDNVRQHVTAALRSVVRSRTRDHRQHVCYPISYIQHQTGPGSRARQWYACTHQQTQFRELSRTLLITYLTAPNRFTGRYKFVGLKVGVIRSRRKSFGNGQK